MAKQPTVAQERRQLDYARKALAGEYGALSDERRAVLEFKVKTISKRLAGKCQACGRKLTSAESLAAGFGSHCIHQQRAA
jgi:hypothetical protein